MKKVIAFVGSAHKQNTHKAVVQFLNNLQALGDVEYEIITLSNYKLGACRGCRVCFEKGEEFCPLKDDRDVLMDKIAASDGVIFATPNYAFHMSGMMKTFLDRFGAAMHRPRYFGKAFTSIVTQGFMGGGDIIKNFDLAGRHPGLQHGEGQLHHRPCSVFGKGHSEDGSDSGSSKQTLLRRFVQAGLSSAILVHADWFPDGPYHDHRGSR